jgi:hypothetical protein
VATFARRATSVRQLTQTVAHEFRSWERSRRIAEAARERSQSALAAVPTAVRRRFAGQCGILGGGTLLNHSTFLRAYRVVRERVGRPVPVFGCGVANPGFWPGRRAGWVDERREWRDVLAELPVVGVRGPLSRDLLLEAGIAQTEMVGDAAILLYEPATAAPPRRAPGEAPLIGFNCGCNTGAMWGSYDAFLPVMIEAVRRLLAKGYRVELVSVWPADDPACEAVLAAVRGAGEVTIAPTFTSSHEEFMAHVRRYDSFVALKLHAGILAAAATVPFIMLEYRPKCRDFALSIDWGDYTARTSDVQPEQIEEMVERQLATNDATRARLAASMQGLRDSFVRYCERIAPLLR